MTADEKKSLEDLIQASIRMLNQENYEAAMLNIRRAQQFVAKLEYDELRNNTK